MYVVGLTGGIGSGKSTIVKMFGTLGICWVDLDIVAREVVTTGRPELANIFDHFTSRVPNIRTALGELNRAALRDYIFTQPSEKRWLESLLHPAINAQAQAQLHQATSPYALLVSPLLFEKNTSVEKSIVIDADEKTQLRRASERDGNSVAQIKKIMATQLSRHERNSRADFIIDNSGSLERSQMQVDNIHRALLTFSKQPKSL